MKITIDYIVSDCCNANLDENEFGKDTCTRCEKECGTFSYTEEYYDEVRADDERGEKNQEAA